MKSFRAPGNSLGDLSADAAASVIVAAADVALVLDFDGAIRDLAIQADDLTEALVGCRRWIGRNWRDIVTVESRPKVEAMLHDAVLNAPPRWRHLNHPSGGDNDVPILYSAVQIGEGRRIVAIGRDLRAISGLQQRLVEAQQSIEQDYMRLQNMEMRYRLLFQGSNEPVFVLDGATYRVTEANPAAGALLGDNVKRVGGRAFLDLFDRAGARDVSAMLANIRATGRADEMAATLADARPARIAGSLFRHEGTNLFLVRLSLAEGVPAPQPAPDAHAKVIKLVESAPDAFVVTEGDGRILTANAAFLDMAQLSREEQVRGQMLERWLGRPGIDMEILIANLRQRGTIRLFASTVNGELGIASDVEVSAVAVTNGGGPFYGFTIRNVARRLSAEGGNGSGRQLPRSVEQLKELIGRVPLKDIVRETTDVIERMCIEAALEMTGDNRASAAEMLGLSRQSLYVKLRRYGIADLATEDNE
ncbi:MAG: transcriptional regulator PpsR [Acidisphaera sp.]|nr:transcriptional regulator PpsR [Acidisphaera sp.]MBV9813279.1 transcriptional regulator PpsR [Acetobacteraceae bacterium]